MPSVPLLYLPRTKCKNNAQPSTSLHTTRKIQTKCVHMLPVFYAWYVEEYTEGMICIHFVAISRVVGRAVKLCALSVHILSICYLRQVPELNCGYYLYTFCLYFTCGM